MNEPVQPPLPDQTWPCPTCHSDGTITVGGRSWNPYVGMLTPDPQAAHDIPCLCCYGTGYVEWDPDDPEFKGF